MVLKKTIDYCVIFCLIFLFYSCAGTSTYKKTPPVWPPPHLTANKTEQERIKQKTILPPPEIKLKQEKIEDKKKLSKFIPKGERHKDKEIVENKFRNYIQTYNEGVNLLRLNLQDEKLLRNAKRKFKDVVKGNNNFWPAYYNLAYISYLNEKYNEAEAYIENTKKIRGSSNKEIDLLQATIYFLMGENEKAFNLFSKITEEYKNALFAYYQMGNILMADKKYKQAITYYDTAGDLSKDFYYQFINKGTCYLNLKLYDEAVKSFNAVYEFDVRDKYLLRQYAYSLNKRGEFQLAASIYKELVKLFPDEVAAYKNLGIIYELYLNNPREAIKYYNLYIKHEGKDKKDVKNWVSISKTKAQKQ